MARIETRLGQVATLLGLVFGFLTPGIVRADADVSGTVTTTAPAKPAARTTDGSTAPDAPTAKALREPQLAEAG